MTETDDRVVRASIPAGVPIVPDAAIRASIRIFIARVLVPRTTI
jgi:hypothetical protein